MFPSVVPFLFASGRVSFANSWKLAALAETFGGYLGVGYQLEKVFQIFSVVTALAWMFFFVIFVIAVERFSSPRPSAGCSHGVTWQGRRAPGMTGAIVTDFPELTLEPEPRPWYHWLTRSPRALDGPDSLRLDVAVGGDCLCRHPDAGSHVWFPHRGVPAGRGPGHRSACSA